MTAQITPFANPPVPPELGDLRWRRIETAIFDELDAVEVAAEPTPRSGSRRQFWYGAAAVAAAAAVVLAVWAGSRTTEPTASPLSRFVTQDASSTMVVAHASIEAAPHSAMWVADNGSRGVVVTLERGSIQCAVAQRAESAPFRVVAGDVVVEVIGTEFAVERDGDSAIVTVQSGVVAILSGGSLYHISAGGRWPKETARAEVAPTVPDDDKPTADKPTADKPAADKPAAVAPKLSAKERYGLAAKLESSDPKKALSIYRQLARSGGKWSATALYAQARLEFELGRRARAKKTLTRYLIKHPNGYNAKDARRLLERLNSQ